VKGESASLSMGMIADLCHEAENEIENIKKHPDLGGGHFLPLAVFLEKLIGCNSLIDDLYGRLFSKEGSLVGVDSAKDIGINLHSMHKT